MFTLISSEEAFQIGYNIPRGCLKIWIGDPELEKHYHEGYNAHWNKKGVNILKNSKNNNSRNEGYSIVIDVTSYPPNF